MRIARTAVLAAGAFVGLSATPALADSTPNTPPGTARRSKAARQPHVAGQVPGLGGSVDAGLLHVGVRLGTPLCLDAGALNTVRVVLRAGPGECVRPAPPVPRPPSPPSPKPPPRPSPTPPPKPAPRPPGAAPPRVPRAVHRAAPPAVARPPARRAAAPSTAPSPHRSVPKAATAPPRRKNPLATVVVLVVLTAVIAAGAGVAFAATP
jgi:hypothetical protein